MITRISTRGYYDLVNGKKLSTNSYFLYPKKQFSKLYGKKELTIMIHGLRNDRVGALDKFIIASRTLKKLGYTYPVIGYTYDANTKGAHLKRSELKALRVGQKIALQNGVNLAQFIIDFNGDIHIPKLIKNNFNYTYSSYEYAEIINEDEIYYSTKYLSPGSKTTEIIIFEIPADLSPAYLEFSYGLIDPEDMNVDKYYHMTIEL